ncbi:hypothetical protein HI914_00196 [Erysiphe necator]|nr:hypothetical protein HI914_00196 [Erysiphe necator]
MLKLDDAYKSDSKCQNTLDALKTNAELGENDAHLPFEIKNNILYAKPDSVHQNCRPVIPKPLEGDIFKKAHDNLGHIGFDRIHEQIANNFYLFNLSKRLRTYLWHCPECKLYYTPRHQSFGSLQPIFTPPVLFHTISIDFILALPKTPLAIRKLEHGYDYHRQIQ